jgi:D-3-phosphoglycerate dehydrogenase
MQLGLSKAALLETIPDYDALIVRSGTQVDADVLAAGSRLQVVGRAGIGVDNIDIEAATAQDVIVMNTPTANNVATAEQTMALMLAVSRRTAVAHASLAAGEWNRSQYVGTELREKVLGVIGLGRIGRLVAERAQAFAMEVIAYDPYVPSDVGEELGVAMVSLEALLAKADYITLHTAVTPETTGMINAAAIAQMKENAILVNVARGKLVDEADLAQALQEGRIKAAAVDVYSQEPPVNNPLIGLPNVLHTPHLGASTVEAQRDVALHIVDQVVDALRGAEIRNALNR